MSLVIVGTVAFDSIETPFGKAEMVVGGAALYGAISASHYTDDVQLVSVIGGDFPQSEAYYASAISLPLYPGLTEADQAQVVSVLTAALTSSR